MTKEDMHKAAMEARSFRRTMAAVIFVVNTALLIADYTVGLRKDVPFELIMALYGVSFLYFDATTEIIIEIVDRLPIIGKRGS